MFLHEAYKLLYGADILSDVTQTPITLKKHVTVTVDGEFYSSKFHRRSKRSSIIMASWPGSAGNISCDRFLLRAHQVLFYLQHSNTVDGHKTEHIMACVRLFMPSCIAGEPPV